ncbi:MAG: hypothetical protein QXM31_00400 [Candidatus Woesearchaeota archaeon]
MALVRHRYTGMDYKTVTKYVVDRKDVFHMANLYLLMHEWLVEHGYASRDDSAFPEKYYLHKEGPTFGGKEIWWRWRPTKQPLENNKLWRFDLDIDVHVLTMKDVEVVIAGKKYKAQQGEVEISVVANLVKDPEKMLEKGAFKDIKKLLFNRLWKQQFDMLEKELYNEAMQFRDALNTYLTIETFLPTKEVPEFWPKRVPE